ncbi:hypothetical protein E5S67_06067 [Microcoleus sp. IPMA8]|uniref:Uncharacterized protein n=1 Tax=Microcoleus asticus IPMA8 TaxID=2563858 RepID=A0ABX2D8J8_9CYAN|nr:hypothetical protein [Microcoleus asticus IPMA8]
MATTRFCRSNTGLPALTITEIADICNSRSLLLMTFPVATVQSSLVSSEYPIMWVGELRGTEAEDLAKGLISFGMFVTSSKAKSSLSEAALVVQKTPEMLKEPRES